MFSRGNSKRLSNGKRNTADNRSKGLPLDELRSCISQLEDLVEISRQRLLNDQKRMQNNNSIHPSKKGKQYPQTPQSQKRNKLRRDKRSRKSSDQETDNPTKNNNNNNPSSPNNNNNNNNNNQQKSKVPRAQFISLEADQENEMVEVIRRLAEIVVLGELSTTTDEETQNTSVSVFEHFCERNALGLIVSIVQGSCFQINNNSQETGQTTLNQSSSHGTTNKKFNSNQCDKLIDDYYSDKNNNNLVYLPPLSVATQAIQSVSILIQNVVRVTSLYFLLSNNRINDLIHLPLELYALAEERERGLDKNNPGKNDATTIRPKSEMSAEMSELATHFISFLKSLALRMNVETLQFFLKYPSVVLDQPSSSNVGEDIFNLKDVEFPLYARALEFCSPNHDNFVRVTAMNICLNTLRLGAVNEADNADDSSHELDSTSVSTGRTSRTGSVRTSTIGNGSVDFEGNVSFQDNDSTSNTEDLVSPDGSLYNAELLPLRERLAIVQHICDPSRVESLMSPIFFKLAQLCGFIEESLRSLHKIDQSINISVASLTTITKRANYKKMESELMNLKSNNKDRYSSPNRKRTPTNKSNAVNHLDQALLQEERKNRQTFLDERKKAVQSIKNYVADLQDELLLLEDVLQVGLVTLNEQIIEMMFATFIYPLLLQPLSLYMQRHRPISMTGNADDHDGNSSFSSVATEESKPTHPFASITPSISLNRWGLLSKEDKNGSGIDKILPRSSKGNSNALNNISISSSNPDSSPARMALFGMASIFHVISNKPLLHLLLTALLHPLAPDPSVGFMVSRNQQILTVNKKGKLQIHVESIMSAFRKSSSTPESYKFGTEDIVRNMENMKVEKNTNNCITSGKKCTFVLSPALADVFEGAIRGMIPSMVKTRTNPYRRVFLACLAGTDGMTTLQPLAVLVLDAVLSSLSKRVLNEILFGAKIVRNVENPIPKKTKSKNSKSKNTKDSTQSTTPNYMVEVIASMCVSVMTAKTSLNGIWRMNFDPVASHALLCATMVNESTQSTAAKLIDHRCHQSLSFLTQLPSKLNSLSSLSTDGNDISVYQTSDQSEKDDDQKLNTIMDSIFFNPLCDDGKCIVEGLSRKQTNDLRKDEWKGAGCVPVARESSIDDLCKELSSSLISTTDLIQVESEDIPFRFAAHSAASHMKLEAFSKILKNIPIGHNHDKKSGCSGLSALVQHKKGLIDHIGGDDRTLFTPIPETLNYLLFEDDESSSLLSGNHESHCPVTGSVVGLVGRTTFPCVCEVAEECDSLFTDKGASVVAEGVKWQSIYLVLLGKYMILAEPEKGGSGGNGRVVTACRLSCLDVEKDNPPVIESASPARRLLLTHTSPNGIAPGVFNPQSSTNEKIKLHPSRVSLHRSRMDLWFEDSVAAVHAYRVLSTKVGRAKARRGHKIREILANDDQLGFSSVFNNS